MQHCHVYARSAELVHTKARSLAVSLLWPQWWVNWVIGPIIHVSLAGWKEPIAASFVPWEFMKNRRRQRWSANVTKLLNKVFSINFTQCRSWKHHNKPNGTLFSMYRYAAASSITQTLMHNKMTTVQPRLSGPHLSGPSIIQTSWRPENTLPRMCRRRGQWSFVGVVTGWTLSYGLCRLTLGKTGLLDYFSEHCWPWSYCIGIVYRLGIINQVRNVGTSVIWTFHLSGMAAISPSTEGSG